MEGVTSHAFNTFNHICYELLGDGDPESCFVLLESESTERPQLFLTLKLDANNTLPINADYIPNTYGNGMDVLNMLKETWAGSIKEISDQISTGVQTTNYIHFTNKTEFINIIYTRFVDHKYNIKNENGITERDFILIKKLLNVGYDMTYKEFKQELGIS